MLTCAANCQQYELLDKQLGPRHDMLVYGRVVHTVHWTSTVPLMVGKMKEAAWCENKCQSELTDH